MDERKYNLKSPSSETGYSGVGFVLSLRYTGYQYDKIFRSQTKISVKDLLPDDMIEFLD